MTDVSNNILLGDHTPGYVWRIPWSCRGLSSRPDANALHSCAALNLTPCGYRNYDAIRLCRQVICSAIPLCLDGGFTKSALCRPYPINTTMVNIQLTIPNAKLIVLVRDPVDRAYSHYHHFLDPEQCKVWGHPNKNPGCFNRSGPAVSVNPKSRPS